MSKSRQRLRLTNDRAIERDNEKELTK